MVALMEPPTRRCCPPVTTLPGREDPSSSLNGMDSQSHGNERAQPARSAGVDRALVRAQQLVDSRPPGPYRARWCAEAMHVGDSRALLMVELARRPD